MHRSSPHLCQKFGGPASGDQLISVAVVLVMSYLGEKKKDQEDGSKEESRFLRLC